MELTNPVSTINLRNFIISKIKNSIDPNNIFIGIQTDGSYPSTNEPYIIILHIDSENIVASSDHFLINDDDDFSTLKISSFSKDIIQVDFYGINALKNAKQFENIVNSQYGNELMSEFNIGCESTQKIANLSNINIGDNAEHRFSITIDVLYFVENSIENIDTFKSVDINIKNIDTIIKK